MEHELSNIAKETPNNEISDSDTNFEPTIDELMDELVDDEQTLREEEEIAALENDNPLDEIATLKEESEMPLEQLLAKYSAMPAAAAEATISQPKRKKSKKSDKKQTKKQKNASGSEAAVDKDLTKAPEQSNDDVAETSEENCQGIEATTRANGNGDNVVDDDGDGGEDDGEVDADEGVTDGESTNKELQTKETAKKSVEKLKIRRSHLFELYPEQNFDSAIEAAQNQETLYSDDDDADDAEEEDETDGADYVKKTIMVGSAFQAVIPGLSQYGDILPYENEDKLIWEPSQVSEAEVEDYLLKVRDMKPTLADEEQINADDKNVDAALQTLETQSENAETALKQQIAADNKSISGETDTSSVVKDNEQALHLLVQCGYDFKEALRRKKLNSVPLTGGTMSIWSEEECHKFEEGIQKFGKDFLKIRQNQVRTRTMRELVQFYYLWKKSERRDHNFANADTVDHMDIYLNEGEDLNANSGSTPAVLTAASTLLPARKINGCNQNTFSIMTGSANSQQSTTSTSGSPSKRKRSASDAANSAANLLNSASGGGNANLPQASK